MVEVQRIITCEATSTRHEAVLRQERHDILSGDSDSNQVLYGQEAQETQERVVLNACTRRHPYLMV